MPCTALCGTSLPPRRLKYWVEGAGVCLRLFGVAELFCSKSEILFVEYSLGDINRVINGRVYCNESKSSLDVAREDKVPCEVRPVLVRVDELIS